MCHALGDSLEERGADGLPSAYARACTRHIGSCVVCRPGFGPSWRVVGLAFSGLIGASVEIGGRSEVATG